MPAQPTRISDHTNLPHQKQALPAEPTTSSSFQLHLPSNIPQQSPSSTETESDTQVTAAQSTLNHFLFNLKQSKALSPQHKQRKQQR